ncbi:hypothetical protein [Pedobacter caeni]|uniref:YhhN-like protein n=1 Tax=Pedobacter caeni TaxID=288992 RepID=A0A1M5K0Z6_9SPHI|nr:hypothetical protein [Pedobacter caeni]SHG46159.1 hypothetical protein SAMN04488522_105574 [Pedobacter caeni]
MTLYFTVNTIIEFSCLLVACLCLYKEKDPIWRLSILYLLFTCFTEVSAIHLRKVLHQSNLYLYNVFLLVECGFISTFFYFLYKKYVNKSKWLIGWLSLFALFYTLELISNNFLNFTFKTASALSVAFVLASLYFYYLILKDEKFERLSIYPPFWWVNGTLIFYFGSTSTNIFFDYLIQDQISIFPQSIRYRIFNILNVLLYCCWSYAFLCKYLQRKSSSSSV